MPESKTYHLPSKSLHISKSSISFHQNRKNSIISIKELAKKQQVTYSIKELKSSKNNCVKSKSLRIPIEFTKAIILFYQMLNVNLLDATKSSKEDMMKYDIVKIRSYPPDGAAVMGEVLDCHYSFSAFVSSSYSLFTGRWIRRIISLNTMQYHLW